jgi:hypothetical protein
VTFCSPTGSVTLERLHLRSERSRELGERTLRTVLLPSVLNVREVARKCRARHMHCGHFACKHRPIAQLNAP